MVVVECVVGITVLLSLIVFQLIVADKVPESSHSVPVIGTMLYFTVLSVILSVD